MAVKKIIEIDVIAPNAQQNINSVTTSLNNATKSSDNLNKTLGGDKGGGKFAGLKDSLGGIIPGFDKASSGASAFNKQLLVLLANPIGLVIAGIALGLTALFKAFQSTDEGADKFEQVMAGLGATLVVVRDTVLKVAGAISKFFSGDFKGAVAEGVAAVTGFGGAVASEFSKAAEATKLLQEVEDSMRSLGLQRAILNKNLAESKELLTDENATYAQKKKAIDEIRTQEGNYTNAAIENAKKRLLAAQLETKLSADERDKNIKDAQVALIELQTESANINRSANRQERALNAQIAADRKAATDARLAEIKKVEDAEIAAQKVREERYKKEGEEFFKGLEESKKNAELLKEEQLKALADGVEIIGMEENANAEAEQRKRDDAKKTAEDKKILAQQELDMVQETFGKIAALAGKNSKIGKAFAVGQALINTYQGISAQIATKPQTPYEIGLVIANVATVAATGFKAVKQILATNPMAASGSGSGGAVSGGSGGGASAAPQFNLVGQSSTNQLAQTISTQQAQPIRTYVVAGDVLTQQAADRNAVQTSTFGG